MVERRKVSTAYKSFQQEIDRLRRLDDTNQARYFHGPGRPSANRLSKDQMYLLTESILARAFSRYEAVIEDVFLLYCSGRAGMNGKAVKSYISPKNLVHARSMLKSGMNFLEWTSPDVVIDRCKTYLEQDDPVFIAISTNKTRLEYIKKIRNAIAHSSSEAHSQYLKVVRAELGVMPLNAPKIGEFLITTDQKSARGNYYLREYLDVISGVVSAAARA